MPDGFMWDDYAMDYVPVHVIQAEEEARRMDGGGTFEETKTIATLDMQVNALRLEVLDLLSKCECLEMINLGLKAERDELRRERDTLQQELDRVSVFLSLHGFPGYEMEIHPVSRVTKEPK